MAATNALGFGSGVTADIGSTGDVMLPCVGGGMRVGALDFDNGVAADISFTKGVPRP